MILDKAVSKIVFKKKPIVFSSLRQRLGKQRQLIALERQGTQRQGTQQQRPESPTATPTFYESKHKVIVAIGNEVNTRL